MSTTKQPYSNQFASNIPKYFVYTALKGFGFGQFAAIWVIYLQKERGLSLSQAALIDVTFFVAAAFGEIPTGMVADTIGRKTSLIIGALLMCAGTIGWIFSPSLPLILVSYVAMGIGLTFLSGAEDALFYESVRAAGRGGEYGRLVGRAGATFPGALAVGSVSGGVLAGVTLVLPFLISAAILIIVVGLVLTFKEPKAEEKSDAQLQPRKSYGKVLKEALAFIRTRPVLRNSIVYLAFVPLASMMVESLFLQPQAIALGVPIVGIGVIVMAAQITSMLGSTLADQLKKRFGEDRILFATPMVIVFSLVMLALFQVLPALFFVGVMGFFTAIIRPLLLSRLQNEVPDDIRATVLSLQSLMFTIVIGIAQPTLGFIADEAGMPATYLGLAFSLIPVIVFVIWTSRQHQTRAQAKLTPAQECA